MYKEGREMPSFRKKKEKTEKEKLEERREEVLSKGRKFKYPLQYAKHRLVILTIVIAVIAIVGLLAAGWFALYKAQNTGDMLYRLTKVVPIPVAEIDGEKVRYSDFLLIYRSSIKPVEQQNGQLASEEDMENMQTHYKRSALTDAENYTYAMKLAREMGVEVTDEDVDKAFDEHRKVGGTERSKESFLKVLMDNFGLSESEYRRMLYLNLIKTAVAQAVDEDAEKLMNQVVEKVAASNGDLAKVAEELGNDKVSYEETGGLVDIMNVDGGRAKVAAELEPGQVSEKFVSTNGDGYYIVKLLDKTDDKVNYVSIKVPFLELDQRLEELREEDGKVKEMIKIEEEEQEQ